MAEMHAGVWETELKTMPGEELKPNDRVTAEARLATENGYVEGIGKEGRIRKFASKATLRYLRAERQKQVQRLQSQFQLLREGIVKNPVRETSLNTGKYMEAGAPSGVPLCLRCALRLGHLAQARAFERGQRFCMVAAGGRYHFGHVRAFDRGHGRPTGTELEQLFAFIAQNGKKDWFFISTVCSFFHFSAIQVGALTLAVVVRAIPFRPLSFFGFFLFIYGTPSVLAAAGIF